MTALSIEPVNKEIKSKRKFYRQWFHNILKRFDVLSNFPFTKREIMRDYYCKYGIYELP